MGRNVGGGGTLSIQSLDDDTATAMAYSLLCNPSFTTRGYAKKNDS